MKAHLTHTTILVHSVERVAEFFKEKNFQVNPPEVFEHEGTREIYIGDFDSESSKILLVEPHGEGPYQKALSKRGPGLHHLGIDVENLTEYCTQLGLLGWLLHTHSLISVPNSNTAYLVRPGVPLMLEVRGKLQEKYPPSLLTGIAFAMDKNHTAMIQAIGLENAKIRSSESGVVLETTQGTFELKDLLTGKA